MKFPIRETIPPIREMILPIRETILPIRETIPPIREMILLIGEMISPIGKMAFSAEIREMRVYPTKKPNDFSFGFANTLEEIISSTTIF